MSIYTGVDSNGIVLSVTIPDDAFPIKGADVNVPFETIIDALAALKNGRGRRDPIHVTDGDHMFDSNTGGNIIILTSPPAADRVWRLRQNTAPVPKNGDWFRFVVVIGASGKLISIKREGSVAPIAIFGPTSSDPDAVSTCEVQLVAGVWRLVGGSDVRKSVEV